MTIENKETCYCGYDPTSGQPMPLFHWIDDLFYRLADEMPEPLRGSIQHSVDHGGSGDVFGSTVVFAAEHGLLTDADKIMVEKVLDVGLLRSTKPYFMDLIHNSPSAPDAPDDLPRPN